MSNKSWVALTGLCVLMATSAAQAHLIPICVEAYESGTEVGGAVDGVTRSFVTFTEAGEQAKPLAEVGTEIAGPYWRASSAANGHCISQADSADSTRQQTLAQGVGPGAGMLLAPVAGLVTGMETSLDPATNVAGLDATDQRQSSWSFDGTVNRRALLAATSTFGQSFGAHGARPFAAGGPSGGAPLNTSEQGSAAQSTRPSVASTNSVAPNGAANGSGPSANIGQGSSNGQSAAIGTAPVANEASNGAAGNTGNGNTGIGNISPVPAADHGGGSGAGSSGENSPATQIPEPETLALLMMGVLGIAISKRRRREPVRTA